jgi:hypothetical protein
MFKAFSNMMEDLRDGFMYELGTEKVGLVNHMENYDALMLYLEPETLDIIKGNELHHQFYSLRWFMLLLCQDLSVSNSMRLWDSLLSAEGDLTEGKYLRF